MLESSFDLLLSANLRQMVKEPTHKKGHTLDLVISPVSEELVTGIKIDNSFPSDHAAIMMKVEIMKPSASRVVITSRKLKNIVINSSKADIIKSPLIVDYSGDLDILTDHYYNILSEILDIQAPKVTRLILRPHTPWYHDE